MPENYTSSMETENESSERAVHNYVNFRYYVLSCHILLF